MALCRLPPPVPILSAAVWRRSRDLAALGLGSVLVFAVPHAAYHLVHGSGARLDAGLGASVGSYGRKQGSTDPRLAYNRSSAPPGCSGSPRPSVRTPTRCDGRSPQSRQVLPRGASQCRAVREVIPGSHPPHAHPPGSSAGGPTTPAPPSTVGESRWSSAISPTVAMRRGQTGVSRSSRRCASSSSR